MFLFCLHWDSYNIYYCYFYHVNGGRRGESALRICKKIIKISCTHLLDLCQNNRYRPLKPVPVDLYLQLWWWTPPLTNGWTAGFSNSPVCSVYNLSIRCKKSHQHHSSGQVLVSYFFPRFPSLLDRTVSYRYQYGASFGRPPWLRLRWARAFFLFRTNSCKRIFTSVLATAPGWRKISKRVIQGNSVSSHG